MIRGMATLITRRSVCPVPARGTDASTRNLSNSSRPVPLCVRTTTLDANADIWKMIRSVASEVLNADEGAEEFLSIFSSVAPEGTVLTLNSENEARCQISHS